MKKLVILGAGSWGLTLAWLTCYHPENQSVWLWGRSSEKIARMQHSRYVAFPVDVTLPERLVITDVLSDAIEDADVVVLSVTTKGMRAVMQQIKETCEVSPKTIFVNASKGIEYTTLKPMVQVVKEFFPNNPYGSLAGPTLAKEILSGLPAAGVVAAQVADVAEYLQYHLSQENLFRVYSNTDVIGVEFGGALKNVFAIASGFMTAKHLGENAKAALITRGLAEMTRFSVAMGAEESTLYGLSGLGDLLATCQSPLSRNFQVGFRLAKGHTLEQVLQEIRVVAEGPMTARAVSQLSDQLGIDMPVVKQVEACLSGGDLSEDVLIKGLMGRSLKPEQVKVVLA